MAKGKKAAAAIEEEVTTEEVADETTADEEVTDDTEDDGEDEEESSDVEVDDAGMPGVVLGYTLANPEKVRRALEGSPTSRGENTGGVARPDGTFDPYALLAEYDRIGGLIRRGTDKVKTGSFYDTKAKKARVEPAVVFQYLVNGEVVEVEDGQELPGIVRAARMLEGKRAAKGKKARN